MCECEQTDKTGDDPSESGGENRSAQGGFLRAVMPDIPRGAANDSAPGDFGPEKKSE